MINQETFGPVAVRSQQAFYRSNLTSRLGLNRINNGPLLNRTNNGLLLNRPNNGFFLNRANNGSLLNRTNNGSLLNRTSPPASHYASLPMFNRSSGQSNYYRSFNRNNSALYNRKIM